MYQSTVASIGGVTYETSCKQHRQRCIEEPVDLKVASGSSDKNSPSTCSEQERMRIATEKME
jgi:hypothetical protein